MPVCSDTLRRWLPSLSAAVPLIALILIVLSIPLAAAQELGLSASETTSWIIALFTAPGLLGLVMTVIYRQPLALTGNLFVIIFIASLGGELSFPELAGASILAGASLVVIAALGIGGRLGDWIPAPVVLGLLAGAIMPFVSGIFTSMGGSPAVVGGAFVTYLVARRFVKTGLQAVLPALLVGIAIAALSGELGQAPALESLPLPVLTAPDFSLQAIATATPVMVVLMTLQSNVPSVVFLQTQGYDPPARAIYSVSGVGTLVASLLGPTGISLSLPVTSLVAGPEAGEPDNRLRVVYVSGAAAVLIGLFAAVAAGFAAIIPTPLLLSAAGLAVVGVLANALREIARGPILLGPLFAFAIALSDISMFGFGPFFWALVLGTGISLLLERDGLRRLRSEAPA